MAASSTSSSRARTSRASSTSATASPSATTTCIASAERVLRAMRLPRILRGGPSVLGAAAVLALAVGMTLAPQLFTGRDPNAIVFMERLKAPSLAHPFGTDENGRDLWARVVYGARPTLTAAVALILISLAVGSLAGLVIGYAGRRADEVLMRVTEFFLAFPQIVWALAIASVVGRGMVVCVLALSLTWWAQYARLMRAQVLVYKEREFILASRALGQRAWWILLRHLLPNCFSPVLVKATIDVSLAILLLAALSFLGVGAQPPMPEWGAMVTIGRKYLLDYPWYATFPGLAIFMVVLAFNILGERVRDALDPASKIYARS